MPAKLAVGANLMPRWTTVCHDQTVVTKLELFLCSLGGMILAFGAQLPLVAQRKTIPIPFVGCKSDGQVGPQPAPKGTSISLPVAETVSQPLSYYESAQGLGVLAPQGWYCSGTYGSGGDTLYVSPQPIDPRNLFSGKWSGSAGPAIILSLRFGGTSGRFQVAEVIARVFPSFVARVSPENLEPASSFPTGPYPKDVLTHKSDSG